MHQVVSQIEFSEDFTAVTRISATVIQQNNYNRKNDCIA